MSHPIEDLERMLDKLYDMVDEMHKLAQETDDTLEQLRPVVARERTEERGFNCTFMPNACVEVLDEALSFEDQLLRGIVTPEEAEEYYKYIADLEGDFEENSK